MRILYIITGLGLGGAEKMVIDLADQMYQRGHQVKIAYLTGEICVRPKNKTIEIIGLNLNGWASGLSASRKYIRLLNDFQPDVVHAHMFHANIFARIHRLFNKIPRLICTAHNSNEGGKLRMMAYRLSHHLADVTTNVSEEASQSFVKKKAVKNNEILTVYNGINLNRFRILSNLKYDKDNLLTNQKVVLAVGRLNEQKDYPNLIHAIALLKERGVSGFQVWIVGEGNLRSQLERLIQDLGLKQDIRLLGVRNDVPELMAIADIFVLSSKFEGLPTVLIEAMACEKFIVATNCGGSAEILGNTGILVPPQNSRLLAQAIEKALNLSEEAVKANGKLARQRVEQMFSLEKSVDKWLELYEAK